MNLIIDIGNSRAKLAVYQKGKIVESLICPKEGLIAQQKKIRSIYPNIENAILANVAEPNQGFEGALSGLKGKQIILSADTKLPFTNLYHSPKTLGLDRIALAAAAVAQFENKNTLIIDAGTCVTYDIVTHKKEYLGGAISPGLNMRFRALNNFTANLPLLRTEKISELVNIGQSTTESLEIGVMHGLTYEIDGFIDQFKQAYNDLTIILTGGDCEILSKSIKNSIFVAKNFLLDGLNHILEFNKTS